MTPTQAAALARRCRLLLRAGQLTHAQHSIADTLLWSCRAPGTPMVSVSYSRLQRLAHASRDSVVRAIRRLEELGLLRKTKRRVRIGWASRQVTNLYELLAPTESDGRPVHREQEKPPTVVRASPLLEAAISRFQAAFARRQADRSALQLVGTTT